MDWRAEDEAVGCQGFGPEFIDDIVKDATADVPAFVTGDTTADRLLADPERFSFNTQAFQGPAYFLQCRIGATLFIGRSID